MKEKRVWYHKGLRFRCTQCGKCCTGSPGYTWVSTEEIDALAKYLGVSTKDFGERYLRRVDHRYALLEDQKNYDCIFLENKRCRVYPVRPIQCRTYPWWPENLVSEETWKIASIRCEGINQNAPVVPCEEIQGQLQIANKYFFKNREE